MLRSIGAVSSESDKVLRPDRGKDEILLVGILGAPWQANARLSSDDRQAREQRLAAVRVHRIRRDTADEVPR